jgi:hypothetical protein
MKTFYEFIDHKNLENSIVRAANLMVEMDVDPAKFVIKYVSENTDIELQEGFLDTIGNIAKGAVEFGKNVWGGGGVTGGWAHAKDLVSGPMSKFEVAVKTLKVLVDMLKKNDATKNMMATDGSNLADHINRAVVHLEKERDMIPRMKAATSSQPTMSQNTP